MDALKTDLIA